MYIYVLYSFTLPHFTVMFVLVIFSIRVRVDVNILQMRSLIENEIIFCSLQTSFPLSISHNFSSIKKT